MLDLRTDKDNPKGIRAYDAPHAWRCTFSLSRATAANTRICIPNRAITAIFWCVRSFRAPEPINFSWISCRLMAMRQCIRNAFLCPAKTDCQVQKWMPDKAQDGWLETTVKAREEQSFAPKSDAPSYVVQLQNVSWQAKKEMKLKARVLQNNVPLTDLQLHLSGAAYGVAISEDGQQFCAFGSRAARK